MPGHKFKDRNGLGSKQEQSKLPEEYSPIFLQFLDCISQVFYMYPDFFEYTPRLLSFILYHSLSGKFCNFLGNCEKDREDLGLQTCKACLWAEVNRNSRRWLNPRYKPTTADSHIAPCEVPFRKLRLCDLLYSGLS